jgi:hypothetical protein
MVKKILLFLNISFGAALAIQALFHPSLDANTRLVYMIVSVVFINTSVFANMAYSAAMSENSFTFFSRKYRKLPKQEADQSTRAMMEVATTSMLVSSMLGLLASNTMFFLEITQINYLIWTIVIATLVPLAIAFLYQLKTDKKS